MPIPGLGQKLLEKIWATLDKGGTGLFRPWQIRRVGKAQADDDRHRRLLTAQTERDIDDVRAGRKFYASTGELVDTPSPLDSGQRLPPPGTTAFLTAAAQSAAIERNVLRALNLSKIISKAEEFARDTPDSEVSDTPIDPDWFARWRSGAEDVSMEELQQLWARILSGEVKQPGTYSLHTVDLLRRLSKTDTEIVAKIGGYVCDGWIFKGATDYLDKQGVSYAILMFLGDIGVLNSISTSAVGGVGIGTSSSRTDKFEALLKVGKKALFVQADDPAKRLDLPAITLTKVGRELISLGSFEADLSYLAIVGQAIRAMGFSVKLCDWAWSASTDKLATLSNMTDI